MSIYSELKRRNVFRVGAAYLAGAWLLIQLVNEISPLLGLLTLQTLPAEPDGPRREVAESSGFSLHAGIAAKAAQRDKLEHLARYVARPPVATARLSLTENGQVRCALKTPIGMEQRTSYSSPRTSSPGSARWCQSPARTR